MLLRHLPTNGSRAPLAAAKQQQAPVRSQPPPLHASSRRPALPWAPTELPLRMPRLCLAACCIHPPVWLQKAEASGCSAAAVPSQPSCEPLPLLQWLMPATQTGGGYLAASCFTRFLYSSRRCKQCKQGGTQARF